MAATCLRLLCCTAQEAVLICVLATICLGAAIFEGSEYAVGTIVFGQVFFVIGQLGYVVIQLSLRRFKLRSCICDGFGFLVIVRSGLCEDAILNEHDAQITKFGVYPVANG